VYTLEASQGLEKSKGFSDIDNLTTKKNQEMVGAS